MHALTTVLVLYMVAGDSLTQHPAGTIEQDASQPEWAPLAELGLRDYLARAAGPAKAAGGAAAAVDSLYSIRVLHVTTQVVGGIRSDLQFVAAPAAGGGPLVCSAAVWDHVAALGTEVMEASCKPQQDAQLSRRYGH